MGKEEFSGVQDTLYIPLGARVFVSKRFPEYFCDKKSLSFERFKKVQDIVQRSNEYASMASVSRYYVFDRMVRDFVSRRGEANIVCLGAGLETMNYRLQDLDACFYMVDFASVMEERQALLGDAKNETVIPSDILSFTWAEEIDPSRPTIFVVSGVFQYFKEEEVLRTIAELKKRFPGSELLFDATNEVGIRYAMRHVKKTGNMSAAMYFYVNDAGEFAKKAGASLLEVRGFFREARSILGRRLKLITRIFMYVADSKKRTLILHLAL